MKFGFQEKIIASGAGLLLMIVGWYFFYYSPQKAEIETIKREIFTKEQTLRNSNVSPAQIDSLKEQLDRLKQESQTNQQNLLSEDRLPFATATLRQKMQSNNLIEMSIQPDMNALLAEPTDTLNLGIRKVPYEITLQGEFLNIGKFLDEFADFPFLVNLSSIAMDSGDELYPLIEVRLRVNVFFKES